MNKFGSVVDRCNYMKLASEFLRVQQVFEREREVRRTNALWVLLLALSEGLRVTHMLYADEMTLTANDPVQLQKMLRRLESYAAWKGLTVNVQILYCLFLCVPKFCSSCFSSLQSEA